MGDREPEGREQLVTLVLRRHHPLSHVLTAPRFLPWIPTGPPLDPEVGDEGRHRQR